MSPHLSEWLYRVVDGCIPKIESNFRNLLNNIPDGISKLTSYGGDLNFRAQMPTFININNIRSEIMVIISYKFIEHVCSRKNC